MTWLFSKRHVFHVFHVCLRAFHSKDITLTHSLFYSKGISLALYAHCNTLLQHTATHVCLRVFYNKGISLALYAHGDRPCWYVRVCTCVWGARHMYDCVHSTTNESRNTCDSSSFSLLQHTATHCNTLLRHTATHVCLRAFYNKGISLAHIYTYSFKTTKASLTHIFPENARTTRTNETCHTYMTLLFHTRDITQSS